MVETVEYGGRQYYRVPAAALALGISDRTLRGRIKRGEISVTKARPLLIPASEIERLFSMAPRKKRAKQNAKELRKLQGE